VKGAVVYIRGKVGGGDLRAGVAANRQYLACLSCCVESEGFDRKDGEEDRKSKNGKNKKEQLIS